MTKTEDFKCAVRADLFARAQHAVSTEETRYYLNGVFVSPAPSGGALMVATNGRWLVAVRDPRGIVAGSGIVKLDKKMIASLKSNRQDVRTSFGATCERVLVVQSDAESPKDGRAMVVINGRPCSTNGGPIIDPRECVFEAIEKPNRLVQQAQFFDVLIDGSFPDYKRVIPEKVVKNGRVPEVDPAHIAKASMALGGGFTKALKMYPSEDARGNACKSGPVLILPGYKQPEDYEILAVVMPIYSLGDVEIPVFWKA